MSKNAQALEKFVAYCEAHPDERFWQSLRNWSRRNYVIVSRVLPCDAGFKDSWQGTFYWEQESGQ